MGASVGASCGDSSDNPDVHLWRPAYDGKKRLRQHTTAPGFGHALLAPVVAHYFTILRVSATLWDAGEWFVISTSPNPSRFEDEHGVESRRGPYNDRHFKAVHRRKTAILGEHAGFSDLFVPVIARGSVVAVLVVGPFLLERPTSGDVLSRWHALTGRQGHPSDPEFAAYLDATLGTVVLDGGRLATFERLTSCLAELLGGEGDAGALTTQAHALGAELERARIVERTWDAVRSMVDDRSARRWLSAYRAYGLKDLGLTRVADSVLVGLVARETPDRDPVDEAIRRDALQRETVHLARRRGDAIAGRVGDHGVVLLCTAGGKSQKLLDLADQTTRVARKFGLSLHFGSSAGQGSRALSDVYASALAAAESALSRGNRIENAALTEKRPNASLRRLRAELGPAAEQPSLLPARFDRYIEAVAVHCAYRADATVGYLDAGFERIAEALADRGAIDPKSYAAMCETLERAARDARTLDDLFGAYRRAVLDLCDAVQKPVQARHERSVRGAIQYIRQHYAEPIRLGDAARVAGLAPNYFAQLFRQRERVTFLEYVTVLRVARAKQLLTGTRMDMTRVAELSGFHSPQYFARVFRRCVGRSPGAYRRRPGHR